MSDLKKVYGAVDEETALYELENFGANGTLNTPKFQSHGGHTGRSFPHISSIRSRLERSSIPLMQLRISIDSCVR